MKTMFDTNELRARILDKYNSIDGFAHIVGMKPETLAKRLDCLSYFKYDEVNKIVHALELNGNEIDRMFFTPAASTEQITAPIRPAQACVSDKLNYMDQLGFIQDGVNAGRLLALGRDKFSHVLDDFDYDNAIEWVFDRLNEQIQELHTSLRDNTKHDIAGA